MVSVVRAARVSNVSNVMTVTNVVSVLRVGDASHVPIDSGKVIGADQCVLDASLSQMSQHC